QRELEARSDVAVYTTAVLEHDLEVTGPIKAELWIASSAPDTDFTPKLVDVLPDGRAWPVCQGITRASSAPGVDTPLDPDSVYRLEIDVWPTSTVFKAGHRIRIDISSS